MNVKNRIPNARNKVALCEAVGEVVRKLKGDCAMKKRFLKSQFDVIRFIAFDAAALVFSLWLMMGNSQELLQLPYFVIIWCVVLFLCQLAFILMAAHTVVIDEQGITRYFFKKQL